MKIAPINFCKKYISKTPVREMETGKKVDFNFVKYENCPEDEIALQDATENWTKYLISKGVYKNGYCTSSNYGEEIFGDFQNSEYRPNEHYYGLEDEKGEIHALCEVLEGEKTIEMPPSFKKQNNPLEILFFITNPKNKYRNPNREYSKIGTSFFKEIVNLAERKKYDYIALSDASHGFWTSLPSLESEKKNEDMEKIKFLRSSKFNGCIKKLDKRI